MATVIDLNYTDIVGLPKCCDSCYKNGERQCEADYECEAQDICPECGAALCNDCLVGHKEEGCSI